MSDLPTIPPPNEQIVVASHVYPSSLPILPLPRRPLFPKTVQPLIVAAPQYVKIVEEAMKSQRRVVGVALIKQDDDNPADAHEKQVISPKAAEVHEFGVIAQILKAERPSPGGPLQLLVGGLDRFEILRVLQGSPHVVADVFYHYEEEVSSDDELRAFALAVINTIKDLVRLNPLFKQELNLLIQQGSIEEPGRLADYAAYLTSARGAELQKVLECLDVRARLDMVLDLLRREVDISKLQTDIRKQIEERVTKQQREYFLREQLKAIKQELGLSKDDAETDIQTYQERLAKCHPSEEARERIDHEIEKLRVIDRASPEHNVTRNYLDWLTSLPWGVITDAEVSLDSAREILSSTHHGLDDVKERIVEHIAAGLLKGSFSGSIICLVGPPGVGKTSIGRSIARALGRPFYRFSLGGMRDEAEIKGHRRTYIGAMPGKFVQALRTCKACDAVIMLDEIDKVGASYRGDPASALLEALDPEQNKDFLDHYLDVRFDLSQVMFVCTANQLDTIPGPLIDRMEIIKLSGYLAEEKLEIALRHLVPRVLKAHGLKKRQFQIGKTALRALIEGYARGPGVRGVEKLLQRIVRKSAVKLLDDEGRKITIRPDDLDTLLGRRPFRDETIYGDPRPGVVMGLAWTAMGGDTLWMEAAAVPSDRGAFKQTGQLGKVMVESSEIAYTQARRWCHATEPCDDYFGRNLIHLHVPAGATPKDGPSAGITMATALVSLARGKPPRRSLAMTGELNLSGHVMPVGGIREKVIAARRAKVKVMILPKGNEGDFERLPDYLKKRLKVHFVSDLDEVLKLALP